MWSVLPETKQIFLRRRSASEQTAQIYLDNTQWQRHHGHSSVGTWVPKSTATTTFVSIHFQFVEKIAHENVYIRQLSAL